MLFFRVFCLAVLCGCWTTKLWAQNLDQVGKKGGVTVKGGVAANQVFYYSDGITARRDPYNYFLSGNVNVSLYGLSLPFTFSFSNQKFGYGQPFNIVGLSPKYKWATAHLGWRSMTFSPYTLNGHNFFGVGVEVEPVKGWKTSAMYGRFLKAVSPDSNFSNRPSYQRMGMGFKTEYSGNGGAIGMSLFTAKDEAGSISQPLDRIGITPMQNVVLGINVVRKIKSLNVTLEGARSAITHDIRSEASDRKAAGVDGLFMLPVKTSTSYYNAFKGNATYQFKWFGLGVGYERIDPNYRTLGAYYFNNDLENITGNFNTALFKNKVSIAANTGVQRDNLDNSKIATMKRWVGAASLGINPSQKWNISLGYSNFQSYANIRPQIRNLTALTPYDNLDTLNFVQISQSAQASVMHILKMTQELSSTITLSGSYQQSSDKRGSSRTSGPVFYNANASYGHNLIKMKLSFNVGANTNISGESSSRTVFVGPSAGVSKVFWQDKLRTGVGITWNTILLNGSSTSKVFNVSQTNSLTLAKKHAINLNTIYVNMAQPSSEAIGQYARAINEVTVTLGYGYSF